jgi:hypothetical protein
VERTSIVHTGDAASTKRSVKWGRKKYLAKDHSEFLSEDFESFALASGFPYLRMHPAILAGEVDKALAAPDERLLLVLHCHSAALLVVSNRRIIVYKIPEKSSVTVQVAKSAAILFVPGFDEISETVEVTKGAVHWAAKLKHWLSPSDRRDAVQRKQDHMPSRDEFAETIWDLTEANGLSLITGYRDRILLENGFGWKTNFEVLLEHARDHLSEIAIGSEGITWKTGVDHAPKYPALNHFAKDKLDPVMIARQLAERNRGPLEAAGWNVEIDSDKVALKRRLDSMR